MKAETTTPLAIRNDVPTGLRAVAVYTYRTYDVWGNARDGWEVNDSRDHGEIKIPVRATISNAPAFPGAADLWRSFPASGSFTTEVVISFHPTDREIRKALGLRCRIETSGDDMAIEIERAKDNYPLGALWLERFEAPESV